MNNKKNGQTAQVPFLPHHHTIYDKLRTVLMGLHQQGVPGIDQLLNTLNEQHVGLSGVQQNQQQNQQQPAQFAGAMGPMPSTLFSNQ